MNRPGGTPTAKANQNARTVDPKTPFLVKRSRILRAVRDFFEQDGFLEVETPVRIPAPVPEAHIHPVRSGSWFLQSSPEICMKRLLARGHDRIFQICRCFRHGERGDHHLPEMTLLEWYAKGENYQDLMARCERLIRFAVTQTGNEDRLAYGSAIIDLAPPWQRITVARAFDRFTPVSMEKALETGQFDDHMAFDIEPNLGCRKPAFLVDYPASMAALSRLKPDNPDVAERFEFYIAGIELANGFTELTDPDEQRRRFESELALIKRSGNPAPPVPEPFLKDLANLSGAAGIALGIDRLVMLLCNAPTIASVVTFTPEEL